MGMKRGEEQREHLVGSSLVEGAARCARGRRE
jgi:hypothetical protein